MLPYEKILEVVKRLRNEGLNTENYWLYIRKDGSGVSASNEEQPEENAIGYFVEDDSRLKGICNLAKRRCGK